MRNEHQEELAALHALGLLDQAEEMELALASDLEEIRFLVQDFDQAAASLAYAVPQVVPPRELKREIMQEISSGRSRIIPFPFAVALPYALAASFLVLALYQAGQIGTLQTELATSGQQIVQLRQENSFQQVRLAQLETQDARYKAASVVLAWNPVDNTGVISAQNLPAAPAGRDYQLWALPTEEGKTPVSAGVIHGAPSPQPFTLQGPSPARRAAQGFAVSVEPSGGSPSPTGQIIFVSAP